MKLELESDNGFWCWRDAAAGVGVCFAGCGPEMDVAGAVRTLAPQGVEPAWLRQVHSSTVVSAVAGCAGEADALVTDQRDLALAIVTADCVPVLIAGREGGEMAAVHAGWRGIAARIVPAAIERLASRPEELTAWIGPAIGRCCYEVGEDVAEQVAAGSRGAEDLVCPGPRGRPHLDLTAAVVAQLRARGLGSVRRVEICTRCHSNLCSYRRDGRRAGRNVAVIWARFPQT